MNVAKVRSALGVALAVLLVLGTGLGWGAPLDSPSAGKRSPTVTVAWLPQAVSPGQLADLGLSPGLMSAGLGSVPAEQTYLDITQGNRVFGSLYKEPLPAAAGSRASGRPAPIAIDRPVRSPALLERAASAPAEIVPGLLARALRAAGRGTALRVRDATPGQLPRLLHAQRGDDLLIAIERPPPPGGGALAIGIAGRGFHGTLVSDSTRLDGYVLSTDVAPTILRRLDLAIPKQMSGRPIRAEGTVDAAAVEALGARLSVISERRGPVIGLTLLVWLGALALVALAGRAASPVATKRAVKLAALAILYLPLVLLFAAALEPGQGGEQLLALLAPPLLAGLTLAGCRGYRAPAVAAALTVLAYAADVVAGSPLTALSLLGPNPGLGVRFYGIGNELEALLAVLVVAGTGMGLAGFVPRLAPRRAAATFLAVGLLAAFVFAAGRFGADVGAAIVFPVGAAVAALTVAPLGARSASAPGARRGWVVLVVLAVPVAALVLIALADLLSGADAHLTRSVLDAGGLGELADVAQRRLQLSAHSFARPVLLAFLPVVAAFALAAHLRRDRLRAWLAGRPAARAGLLGALAATLVGTLANDSGALLLEVGAAYLLVFCGYVWADTS